ncbi:DUF72 domain-containing protein [Pyrofollis japonicus]|uniref:DUF72 domain-containing protein n=1 Tax=Pyrofollis japonicus TaxID=3060460 RepID=UPI00295BB782|nr:DUF72 domain-containing protein [Pyrofollis japonicus]BEP17552.1 DUF72 domain-containing protein [Pyrofollis japonicus]
MPVSQIWVGCCGFPVARKKYFEHFKTVELQQTFYNLPEKKTAEKWRNEAPTDFRFNMKAWQVITHPASSPTWRRLRQPPPGKKENYGYMKPTRENLSAWIKTVEIAAILNAHVIVLQTPPSFGYSEENATMVREFFKEATGYIEDKGKIVIGWEPRGTWRNHKEVLQSIMCNYGIIHIVDPLRDEPIICQSQSVLYFRLHGLGGREVNYRYKYTDEDLSRLVKIIEKYIVNNDISDIYVMFNNIYMFEDAQRFRSIARDNFATSKQIVVH